MIGTYLNEELMRTNLVSGDVATKEVPSNGPQHSKHSALRADPTSGNVLEPNSGQERFLKYLKRLRKKKNSRKRILLATDQRMKIDTELALDSSTDGSFSSVGAPPSRLHNEFEIVKLDYKKSRGLAVARKLRTGKFKGYHLRVNKGLIGETAGGDRVRNVRGVHRRNTEADLPPEERAKIRIKRGALWDSEDDLERENAPHEGTQRQGGAQGSADVHQSAVGSRIRALDESEAMLPPEDRAKIRTKRGGLRKRKEEFENTIRNDILIARKKPWGDSSGEEEIDEEAKEKSRLGTIAQKELNAPQGNPDELSVTEKKADYEGAAFGKDQEEGRGSGYQDGKHAELANIRIMSQELPRKNRSKRKVHSADFGKIYYGDTITDVQGTTEDISGQNLGQATSRNVDRQEGSVIGGSADGTDEHQESNSFELGEVLKEISEPSSGDEKRHADSVLEMKTFFSVANRKGRSKDSGKSARGHFEWNTKREPEGDDNTTETKYKAEEETAKQEDEDELGDEDFDSTRWEDTTNQSHAAASDLGQDSLKGPNKTRQFIGEKGQTQKDEDDEEIQRARESKKLEEFLGHPDSFSSGEQGGQGFPNERELTGERGKSEKGQRQKDEDDEKNIQRAQDIKQLEEFLGHAAGFPYEGDVNAGSGPDTTGYQSEDGEEEWGMLDRGESKGRSNGNYRMGMNKLEKEGKTKETEMVIDSGNQEQLNTNNTKEKGIGTESEERNHSHVDGGHYIRNSTKTGGCTSQKSRERHRKIVNDLEQFINYEKCTAEDTRERRRMIVVELEDLVSCIAKENNDQQKKIITDIENFMNADKCIGENSPDRLWKIISGLEAFSNFTATESREREREITRNLEHLMKEDADQVGRGKIIADVQEILKDSNCTTDGSQEERKKILADLEHLMANGSCLDQENTNRKEEMMADLERFMATDSCKNQGSSDRQRKIVADLETFMKADCDSQRENAQTNNEQWPEKNPEVAVSKPLNLLDIRGIKEKLLQAQRQANGKLDELGLEMRRKLGGLETNLRVVTQLANALDRKIAGAVENALELSKDASLKAKSKLFQVKSKLICRSRSIISRFKNNNAISNRAAVLPGHECRPVQMQPRSQKPADGPGNEVGLVGAAT